MLQTCEILKDGKPVGEAFVHHEGLYYRIQCICDCSVRPPFRIAVESVECGTDLGLCVPTEHGFGLHTRVPAKRIGSPPLRFTIVPDKENHKNGPFIPVDPMKPFPYIQKLRNARFTTEHGKAGIVIEEGQISISSPTGQ